MSRKLPREDIFSLPEANPKTFEKTTFKNVLLKSFKQMRKYGMLLRTHNICYQKLVEKRTSFLSIREY